MKNTNGYSFLTDWPALLSPGVFPLPEVPVGLGVEFVPWLVLVAEVVVVGTASASPSELRGIPFAMLVVGRQLEEAGVL